MNQNKTNYNWNPKSVLGRLQERGWDLVSINRLDVQQSTASLLPPWVPSEDEWIVTLNTEPNYPGGCCELLTASGFSSHIYLRFNKHFWGTTVYNRRLLELALLMFSPKSSGSKTQALSIVSQQPPSQVIRRKEDKYPHMNLCEFW